MYEDLFPPDDDRELFRDPTRGNDPDLRERLPYGPDSLSDRLDALEQSIEGPRLDGDRFLDPVGRMLDRLEAATEGTVAPPPTPQASLEPDGSMPPAAAQPTGSYTSKPPAPEAPVERAWGDLAPPRAAVPFLTRRGWQRPGVPRGSGRSVGRTTRVGDETKRICPDKGEIVDEVDDCPECEQFKDWAGDGAEKCYYDWLDEKATSDAEQEG